MSRHAPFDQPFSCAGARADAPRPVAREAGSCARVSDDFARYYSFDTWIPDGDGALRTPPRKELQLAFHVIQHTKADPRNFDDSAATRTLLESVLTHLNWIWSTIDSPSDPCPNVNYLTGDSAVAFSLGAGNARIYFHESPDLYDSTNISALYDLILASVPDAERYVNVFFVEGSYANADGFAPLSSWSLASRHYVAMLKRWSKGSADWDMGGLLAHEMAHNLGLLHTYGGTAGSPVCDSTSPDHHPDLFCGGPCPHLAGWVDPFQATGDLYTNNIVGGTKSGGHLVPTQLGHCHRSLALQSIRRFVADTKHDLPHVVEGHERWDFDLKLYRDLVVRDGACLEITCKVVFPREGSLIIEPGGRVILRGGTLTAEDNWDHMWRGVEVHGDAEASQAVVRQGRLVMTDGATISHARQAVTLFGRGPQGDDILWATTGGILEAYDAVFLNNRRGVGMQAYGSTLRFRSLSRLERCHFLTQAPMRDKLAYPGDVGHIDFIAANAVNGLVVVDCVFEVAADAGLHGEDRGVAIALANATVTVDRGTHDGATGCRFVNLYRGLLAEGTEKVSDLLAIRHATFDGCATGVDVAGVVWRTEVVDSAFRGGDAVPTDGSTDDVGVRATAAPGLLVEGCTFERLAHGCVVEASGTCGERETLIAKSTFEDCVRAVSSSNASLALRLVANRFRAPGGAAVAYWTHQDGAVRDQGACDGSGPSGNLFEDPVTTYDIVSTDPFTYAVPTGASATPDDDLRPTVAAFGHPALEDCASAVFDGDVVAATPILPDPCPCGRARRQALQVFGVTTTGDAPWTTRDATSWTPFAQLSATAGPMGTIRDVAACSDADCVVTVVIGQDLLITERPQDGDAFALATSITQVAPGGGGAARVDVALEGDALHLVAVTDDPVNKRQIEHVRRAGDGTWSTWTGVTKSLGYAGYATEVAATVLDDALIAFALDSQGAVSWTRLQSGVWTPFAAVDTAAAAAEGGVVDIAATTVGDEVVLVMASASGALRFSTMGASGSWTSLDATVVGQSGVYLRVDAASVGQALHIAAVRDDGHLMHTLRDALGAWQGWFGDVEGPAGETGMFAGVAATGWYVGAP